MCPSKTCKVAALLAALLATWGAWTDTIVVSGKRITDVIVSEGAERYYIQYPRTGKIATVPKESVPRGGVERTPDKAGRQALLAQWKAANAPKRPVDAAPADPPARQPVKVSPLAAPLAAPSVPRRNAAARTSSAPGPSSRAGVPKTANRAGRPGISIHLKNVPLGDALKVVLRQENLDYRVEDGYIFVSSPEILRREAAGPVETRFYRLKNVAQSLPGAFVRLAPAGAAPQGPVR